MKKQVKVKVAGAGSNEPTETPVKGGKVEPQTMASFAADNQEATPPDIIVEN